jgi:nitrite reductase/ring-hydroxylating ferredoxin subunit
MLSREQNELLVRVGPETGMGQVLRRFWIPALLSAEIPEPDCPPVRVRLLGEDLVAFRDSNGRVGLLDAYCPHRRASLFWGRNEECGLRCVYHGWKFDVHGECVDLPNAPGGDIFKVNMRTLAYPTVERSGLVWCYMGPVELLPEPPAAELFNLPESHRYIEKIVLPTNWVQSMEGDIDSSHVGFLHRRLDGELLTPGHISSVMFESRAPEWTVRASDYGLTLAARRDAGAGDYLWRINQWLMPFTTLVAAPTDFPCVTNVRVPIDDETTMHLRIYARYETPLTEADYARIEERVLFPEMIPGTFQTVANRGNDYTIDRELQRRGNFSGIRSVPVQDYAVTSDQGGGAIADRSKEHLTTSDAAIVMMRKKLLEAAAALAAGNEPPEAQRSEAYRVRSIEIKLPRDADVFESTRDYTHRSIGSAPSAAKAAAEPARIDAS